MHKEKQKTKLENFSKIKTLRKRWENENLKTNDLRDYNQWATKQKFEIVEIELRIEHYLCKNILYDLKGVDDLFINKEKYFSSKNLKNGIIDEIIDQLKQNTNKSITINLIKNLTLGKKIILWQSLKKNIFKNKFLGLKSKEKKEIIIALRNVRNIRNGIAHLESKEQILKRLKVFDPKEKNDKETIYKKSMGMCKKMQQKRGVKND